MAPDVGNVGAVGGIGLPDPIGSPHRRAPDETGMPAPKGTRTRHTNPVPPPIDTVTVGETSRRFEIDPALRRVVFKVLDEHTGEVIRQVPPVEALAVAKFLDQVVKLHTAGSSDQAGATG